MRLRTTCCMPPLCEPRFAGSWISLNQRQNTMLLAIVEHRAHVSVDFAYFLHPADKQPFRADACVHAGFHRFDAMLDRSRSHVTLNDIVKCEGREGHQMGHGVEQARSKCELDASHALGVRRVDIWQLEHGLQHAYTAAEQGLEHAVTAVRADHAAVELCASGEHTQVNIRFVRLLNAMGNA